MVATGEARPSEVTAGVPQLTVDEPPVIVAHGAVADHPAQRLPGPADRPAEKTGGGRPIRRYRWLALGLARSSPRWRPQSSCSPAAAPRPGKGNCSKRCSGLSQTTTSQEAALAAVRLNGDMATVTLDTTGLLNGAPYAMHIHAFGEGICPPPSAAKLYNGHPAISTTDGLKYYGPMAAALTLSGDTSMNSMLAFPRYPNSGNIRYQRTIAISTAAPNAIRNGNAVVVVHGIDYNHNGR